MLLLSHNNLITWNGELHIVLLLAGVEISIGNNKLKSTLNSSKGNSPCDGTNAISWFSFTSALLPPTPLVRSMIVVVTFPSLITFVDIFTIWLSTLAYILTLFTWFDVGDLINSEVECAKLVAFNCWSTMRSFKLTADSFATLTSVFVYFLVVFLFGCS